MIDLPAGRERLRQWLGLSIALTGGSVFVAAIASGDFIVAGIGVVVGGGGVFIARDARIGELLRSLARHGPDDLSMPGRLGNAAATVIVVATVMYVGPLDHAIVPSAAFGIALGVLVFWAAKPGSMR